MSTAGSTDAPIEIFGGLVTDMAPATLPHGVSPDCQDVIFRDGGVRTRPGLQAVFGPLANNPTVNYLKTYVTLAGTLRTLLLDSAGVLYKETVPGTVAAIAGGLVRNAFANSASLFGREYLAISDGRAGTDLPRQFDDSTLDRVSQSGPGSGVLAAPQDVVANIAGITRAANIVTVTTQTAHNLFATDQVVVAAVAGGATAFNGTFAVASIVDTLNFTYAQTAANESGTPATGTAAPVGNVPAGVHQVVVIFKTRQGYLTKPSPPVSWTAAGARRVNVSGIPTGPANITARILAFTGAGGAAFFFVGAGASLAAGNMIVGDNTTTSAIIDFSDATLLAATSVDYLNKFVELAPAAGVIDYAQRLFWWGERNKINNWVNLGFDGGWTPALPFFPLGWTPDATFAPGGTKESANVIWGDAYSIVGNGSTPTRGLITQTAVKDLLGVPLIQSNIDYSVRARICRNNTLVQGAVHIHLYSATAGINTAGITLAAAQLSANYSEFTAPLTASLAAIPADLQLRIFADGSPNQNGAFYIDALEIFPTKQPVNSTLVRASRVEDPESYDGVNGILNVAENNGQAVRAAFRLRERLYFVKEHSLFVTQDDGTNEPALWPIAEVSRRVGTPSVRGVGFGEDWVVIANRSGLYIFYGSEPVKISQELQPLWNTINWSAAHTLWVTVDTKERRILVGAPFGAATSPNKILALDYRDLDSADQIASRPPVHISFSGRKTALDKSRKWAPWSLAANSCAVIERTDGTAQVFLGGGTPGVGGGSPTGKVYQLSDAQLSDDGAAIPSYYTTHYIPERLVEQQLALGAHRKLFTYLTMFVEGAGLLGVTAFVDAPASPRAQQPLALSSPPLKDLELPINVIGEREPSRFPPTPLAPGSACKNSSPPSAPTPGPPFAAEIKAVLEHRNWL